MNERRRLAGVPSSPAALLGLLSLLLGLVAGVALASGGGSAGGDVSDPREPSQAFWDWLFTLSIVVAVVGFAVSVWLLKQRLDPDVRADRKGNHLLLFVFLGLDCTTYTLAAGHADAKPHVDKRITRHWAPPSWRGNRSKCSP